MKKNLSKEFTDNALVKVSFSDTFMTSVFAFLKY